MARIRTIKPEFWIDEDLSAVPAETHLLAAALLNHADDEGYFKANPKLVEAACCPLREDSVSVQDSLNQLQKIGYIKLGTGADGKRYGFVVGFVRHQKVNRPTPSKISSLDIDWSDSVTTHGDITEDSPPERNREQGKEQGTGKGKRSAQSDENRSALEVDDPVFIHLPLIDGTDHAVTEPEVTRLQDLYQAIDVEEQLRLMVGWIEANPKNRKTRKGVKRFIAGWLMRAQDKAPPTGGTVRPFPNRQQQLEESNRQALADWRPPEAREG